MLQQHRSRLSLVVFSFFTALMLLVSACGPAGTPTTNGSQNGQPVKGGVWIDDLINEPDSFIPNASVQNFAVLVMQALYAPLFVGDPNGQIQPGITTEVPSISNQGVSPDAKTWTFHLRPGLKWSDGQPLTADDVDYTWKLWQNPKFAAANTSTISHIASATVSPDKLSITFHLKDSFAPFLTTWTDGGMAPLPKHHFETMAPDQIKKSPDNLQPTVVSGPFTMTESKPGDHYTVSRNPSYYRASEGLPHLDKIVFRAVGNQNTLLKDLQSGAVDSASFLDAAKLPSYKQLNAYQLLTKTSASYEAIHFNQHNPLLQDVSVRQAISLAIDRDMLIKTTRQGAALPLCTDHTPVYKPGYQEDIQCPKFDLNAANQLLDQAGWKLGTDGVRQKGDKRLEFQYTTTSGIAWREQDETINQANFAKIGIKVIITNYPSSTFFSTFLRGGQPGKYDLAEWASSYNYDGNNAANFACEQVGKSNFNYTCSPELDALMRQEQSTADPEKRQQAFNQIHQLMLKDLPVVSMFSPNDLFISKKGTFNYKPGPFGATETVNVWDWWCGNGKCPSAG